MADGKGQRELEGLLDIHLLETFWREGGKTRNVHLGSTRKMDAEAARQKARARKAKALVTVRQEIDDHAWQGSGRAVRCDGKRPILMLLTAVINSY